MKPLRVESVNKKLFCKGFTVIELLISITIIIIIALILSLITRTAFNALSKIKTHSDLLQNITLGFELMRREIEGAIYLDPETGNRIDSVNFVGTNQTDSQGNPSDILTFHCLLSPEDNTQSDISSVNYKRLTSEPNVLKRASQRQGTGGIPPLVLSEGSFEDLVYNVTSFNLTYLDESSTSYDSWDASLKGKLPEVVKIQLTLQPTKGKEKAKTFTQTIFLINP